MRPACESLYEYGVAWAGPGSACECVPRCKGVEELCLPVGVCTGSPVSALMYLTLLCDQAHVHHPGFEVYIHVSERGCGCERQTDRRWRAGISGLSHAGKS